MTRIPDEFEIIDLLGTGGMGEVYQARQAGLDRHVAVKIMSDHAASHEVLRKRFLLEAKTAARVRHPNLIEIYDWGEHRGHPYLVMEHVDGTDLQHLVTKDLDRARKSSTEWITRIATAVGALHEARLVHRDLKPGNVMKAHDGRIVVMDFGLVKDLEQKETLLTEDGSILGTAQFLAPESLMGDPVDPRADIWAIGCVWFFLQTGKYLFERPTMEAFFRALVKEPLPDLRTHLPDLDDAGIAILDRCLSRDPADRYPDARALSRDLQCLMDEATTKSFRLEELRARATAERSPPPRRIGARSRALVGAAGAFALLAGAWLWPSPRLAAPEPDPIPSTAAIPSSPTPTPPLPDPDFQKLAHKIHAFARQSGDARQWTTPSLEKQAIRSLGRGEAPPGPVARTHRLLEGVRLLRGLITHLEDSPPDDPGWFRLIRYDRPIRALLRELDGESSILPMAGERAREFRALLKLHQGISPRDLFCRYVRSPLDTKIMALLGQELLEGQLAVAREIAARKGPGLPFEIRLAEALVLEDLLNIAHAQTRRLAAAAPGSARGRLRDEGVHPLERLTAIARELDPEDIPPPDYLSAYPCIVRTLDVLYRDLPATSPDRARIPRLLEGYHRLFVRLRPRRKGGWIKNLLLKIHPDLRDGAGIREDAPLGPPRP